MIEAKGVKIPTRIIFTTIGRNDEIIMFNKLVKAEQIGEKLKIQKFNLKNNTIK